LIDSQEATLLYELANEHYPNDVNEIILSAIEIARFSTVEVQLPCGKFPSFESIFKSHILTMKPERHESALNGSAFKKDNISFMTEADSSSTPNDNRMPLFSTPVVRRGFQVENYDEGSSSTLRTTPFSVTFTPMHNPFGRKRGSTATPPQQSLQL